MAGDLTALRVQLLQLAPRCGQRANEEVFSAAPLRRKPSVRILCITSVLRTDFLAHGPVEAFCSRLIDKLPGHLYADGMSNNLLPLIPAPRHDHPGHIEVSRLWRSNLEDAIFDRHIQVCIRPHLSSVV
eukprot:CAMPEP_0194504632 /NCGR_PEP_ID=MMETSP0253-20130528/29055_1 /TAXON_ID=2966 /ORGANISM="Noctiluca scintillans" /LENGTH=128 /DNA_ID=CAMNT_0039347051 /DNA_START=274 /DNA_END=661 /DNA_ORIENTATION=-